MEFWVERRGAGQRLDFHVPLNEIHPVTHRQRLRCVFLQLEGELFNVFDCAISLRYKGSQTWQDIPLRNQSCVSSAELIHNLGVAVPKLMVEERSSGASVEIWMESYSHQLNNPVEFKFNRHLALILGLKAEFAYEGRAKGRINVNALVEKVAVVSPHVPNSVSVNTSELACLGTFALSFHSIDGQAEGCRKLVAHDSFCNPTLLSRFSFSLNSLLSPGHVIRADTFRVLACFRIAH